MRSLLAIRLANAAVWHFATLLIASSGAALETAVADHAPRTGSVTRVTPMRIDTTDQIANVIPEPCE